MSVIPQKVFKSIPGARLKPAEKILSGPGHKVLPVKGQFVATLLHGDKQVTEDVFVVQRLSRALLGRLASKSLDLVSRENAVQLRKNLLHEFPKLFGGLGKLEGEYKIQLKEGAKPYALTTPRCVAIPMQPKVKAELERMEMLGVVSRVKGPNRLVRGYGGGSKGEGRVRICVVLARLNESVRREYHLLPAVEQTLAQLAGAQVFTKLDSSSGFWQVPLEKESALLTTFITPFGRFCFNHLPFGISSAPEHFQRRMSEILHGVEGAVCLVDDIFVHGRSQEEHDRRLVAVLHRLQEVSLTLNEKKCEFSQPSVKFFGQIVDQLGVRPDPDEVSAILNLRTPCVGDIRCFLVMTNLLGKFSRDLADKAKPLRDLLSSKNHWCWEGPQQKAFLEVKEEISKSPVLARAKRPQYQPMLHHTVLGPYCSRNKLVERGDLLHMHLMQ